MPSLGSSVSVFHNNALSFRLRLASCLLLALSTCRGTKETGDVSQRHKHKFSQWVPGQVHQLIISVMISQCTRYLSALAQCLRLARIGHIDSSETRQGLLHCLVHINTSQVTFLSLFLCCLFWKSSLWGLPAFWYCSPSL